jgi:hypothetical protein
MVDIRGAGLRPTRLDVPTLLDTEPHVSGLSDGMKLGILTPHRASEPTAIVAEALIQLRRLFPNPCWECAGFQRLYGGIPNGNFS